MRKSLTLFCWLVLASTTLNASDKWKWTTSGRKSAWVITEKAAAKTCPCPTQCACGCNGGAACTCGTTPAVGNFQSPQSTMSPQPVYYYSSPRACVGGR